jgi:hypothetical protein
MCFVCAAQEMLRQHLQQHAFSTATAQDTLTRILQLAPPDMLGSADQVITDWQAPGSPLIQLTLTPEVRRHWAGQQGNAQGCWPPCLAICACAPLQAGTSVGVSK